MRSRPILLHPPLEARVVRDALEEHRQRRGGAARQVVQQGLHLGPVAAHGSELDGFEEAPPLGDVGLEVRGLEIRGCGAGGARRGQDPAVGVLHARLEELADLPGVGPLGERGPDPRLGGVLGQASAEETIESEIFLLLACGADDPLQRQVGQGEPAEDRPAPFHQPPVAGQRQPGVLGQEPEIGRHVRLERLALLAGLGERAGEVRAGDAGEHPLLGRVVERGLSLLPRRGEEEMKLQRLPVGEMRPGHQLRRRGLEELRQLAVAEVEHLLHHQIAHGGPVEGAQLLEHRAALPHPEAHAQGRPVVLGDQQLLQAGAQRGQRLEGGRGAPELALEPGHEVPGGVHEGEVPEEGHRRQNDEQRGEAEAPDGVRALDQPVPPARARAAHREAPVLEDDLPEDVAEEVALRVLGSGLGLGHRALQTEGGGHRPHHPVDGPPLLGAAGEVHPAEQRSVLVDVGDEDRLDELGEVAAERVELRGELEDALPVLQAPCLGQPVQGPRAHLRGQLVEQLGEPLAGGIAFRHRQGEAPDLSTLVLAQLAEGLDEAGEEVALGEEHVDRKHHLQPGHHLVHPLADALAELPPSPPRPARRSPPR